MWQWGSNVVSTKSCSRANRQSHFGSCYLENCAKLLFNHPTQDARIMDLNKNSRPKKTKYWSVKENLSTKCPKFAWIKILHIKYFSIYEKVAKFYCCLKGSLKWVPRGGVDLVVAFLSEGPRFEPCRQLWKKLFQDKSLVSHNREWDESARK